MNAFVDEKVGRIPIGDAKRIRREGSQSLGKSERAQERQVCDEEVASESSSDCNEQGVNKFA